MPSLRSRNDRRRPSHIESVSRHQQPGTIGEEEGGLPDDQPPRWIASTARSERSLAASQSESDFSPAWHARQAQIAFAAPVGAWLDRPLLEAIVHGFHAQRYGAAAAAADPRWRPRCKRDELLREIRRYERHRDRRPQGWPESGVAALLTFATYEDPDFVRLVHRDEWGHQWTEDRRRLQRPDTLAGALKRLRRLARQMAAVSDTVDDLERRRTRRRRGAEKRLEQAAAADRTARIKFRATTVSVLESDDARRERIRDGILLADDDPIFYADLDAMELALIAHEQSGRYTPRPGSPSAALQRLVRGAPMPTWWDPSPSLTSAPQAWARVIAAAAAAGADRTTLDLWCEQLEAVALADGHLVLRGPDYMVRYASERLGGWLADTARWLGLTLHWQKADGSPLEAPAPSRRERAIGADGRRMLGELYLRDLRRGRWNL